jgi:hypothetical protein
VRRSVFRFFGFSVSSLCELITVKKRLVILNSMVYLIILQVRVYPRKCGKGYAVYTVEAASYN